MNTASSPLRLASIFALLLLGGCNTAYREAFNRAREAAIRGDFLTAARSYRDACRAAPDDEEACGRVPLFSVKATDQAITSARPGCDAGELDRCLPPLLDARDLLPEHVEVNAMLEKASQLHTERCASQWKEDGSVGSAVAGPACLQARGHQLPVAAYQDLLASRASQLSTRFATLATTARSRGTQGAAAVLWTTAQCRPLEHHGRRAPALPAGLPRPEQHPRGDPARRPHLPSHRPAPVLPVLQPASGLPRGSRCAENGTVPGQPSPLVLQVDAVVQRVVERVSEDVNHVRYVSGTRQVPNPRFERARDRLGDAERELRRAERAFEEKDKECKKNPPAHDATCVGCPDTAPASTPACDEARRLDEERKQKVAAREEAGRELDGLPETVTEDVHDTFTYSVLTHDWSSPYQFTLRANTPGARRRCRMPGCCASRTRSTWASDPPASRRIHSTCRPPRLLRRLPRSARSARVRGGAARRPGARRRASLRVQCPARQLEHRLGAVLRGSHAVGERLGARARRVPAAHRLQHRSHRAAPVPLGSRAPGGMPPPPGHAGAHGAPASPY
ncbi:hypothetical protein ACN28S_37090 [Cystobacter fuscus]